MYSQSHNAPCGTPEKEHSLLDHPLNSSQTFAKLLALTTLRPWGPIRWACGGCPRCPPSLPLPSPAPGFASGPQAACMHWNCSDYMVAFQRNSLSQSCQPGIQSQGRQLDRESSAVSLPDHYKTPNSISCNKLRLPGQKGSKNIQLSKLLIFHSVLWDFSS